MAAACDAGSPKVVEWAALLAWRERSRAEGKTVVWTNGCFDLLHVGHVRSLRAARALGDSLVVGVNSDASVRRLKGAGRPIVPAAERAEVLAALECVDRVVLFEELDPEAALATAEARTSIARGPITRRRTASPSPKPKSSRAYGGRVEFLPLSPAVSTSDLVKRICTLAGRERGDNESAPMLRLRVSRGAGGRPLREAGRHAPSAAPTSPGA